MENIFQIWDRIGRKTPFAVRRVNWSNQFYTVVEQIECEQMPYGKAFGYPTEAGIYTNHYQYDKNWRKEKRIPCDGCYQWFLVENTDISTYKKAIPTLEKDSRDSYYMLSSHVNFGMYKGKTVDDIFFTNPNYIEWAINNLACFILDEKTINYLHSIKSNFRFKEETIENNSKKLKLWEQSISSQKIENIKSDSQNT